MLESNGRTPKERRNYHMLISEFINLVRYIMKHWDTKWSVFILIQFSLGLRCSEAAAIQLKDFSDECRFLRYRCAKTNKIIEKEPIPEIVRKIIIGFISLNKHRFIDGYIFPNHTGKGSFYSTKTIGAMWTKWRRGCAKEYKCENWLDTYEILSARYRLALAIKRGVTGRDNLAEEIGVSRKQLRTIISRLIKREFITNDLLLTEKGYQFSQIEEYQIRHRISSHSLRRLHRTAIRKELLGMGVDEYIISKILHYDDFNAYLKYINEFEYLQKRGELVLPAMNKVLGNITNMINRQKTMAEWNPVEVEMIESKHAEST